MITGKTASGFEFSVSEDNADDMEFLEWLIEMDNGEIRHLKDMMVRLLGEKQKEALYEHCRKENGRVSSSAVIAELGDIIKGMGNKGKN